MREERPRTKLEITGYDVTSKSSLWRRLLFAAPPPPACRRVRIEPFSADFQRRKNGVVIAACDGFGITLLGGRRRAHASANSHVYGEWQMLMKRVLAKVALAGVLASVLVSGSPVRAAMNDDNEGNRLAGSWDIRITQPDYSPLPFGLDFRILRTVTAEGVIDAYAFPGFGPAGPSPLLVSNSGHGSWKRLPGGRRYSVTVKYFQMDQSAFPFVLNSIGTVTEQITVSQDGDSYTSQFVTQIHSPAGDLLFTNTGGTKATRIK